MTEKYVSYRGEIQEEDHHFAFADSSDDARIICNRLNELEFHLKECREHKLYSRRKLENENSELRITLAHIKKEFRERGILTEKEFLELIK